MKNISPIVKLSSIVCIGGMLTACSTSHHSRASLDDTGPSAYSSTRAGDGSASINMDMDRDNASSSFNEASGANRQYSDSSRSDQEIIIPLHEERLNVGKQTVEAGQVRLRKVVTTETVNRPVELRRETVVIERVDSNGEATRVGQVNSTGANSLAQPFEQGEITIRLSEERPVVEKETFVRGKVVARKNSETDRQSVSREVRREDVQLDRSGNTANINIRGDFREASGAQTTSNSSQQNNSVQSAQDNSSDASISASASTDSTTASGQAVLQNNPNAQIPDARGNSRNNPAVETSPGNDNQQ